jgi:hypothetical protein
MKDALLLFIRHVLLAAGGGLVGNGLFSSGDLEVIVGAIVLVIGSGWSFYQRNKLKQEVINLELKAGGGRREAKI